MFYKWSMINSIFADWFSPGFLKIWLILNCISYILYIFLLKEKLWKILKEMGIPDHLTCLLRNLCAGKEATVRTKHGTMDWFKIGKRVRKGCILSPCLFNLYAEWKWIKWSHSVVSNSLRPVGCSPPSSSNHGILQARILEWVAIAFSDEKFLKRCKYQTTLPTFWEICM